MERVNGSYIGNTPAVNVKQQPGVNSMEQTLELLENDSNILRPNTDTLLSYTTLLLDMEDVDGQIVDTSGRNHIVRLMNNATITTVDKASGNSSVFLNGSNAWIEIPSSYDNYFGSQDFTIECTFKVLTLKESAILSKEQTTSGTSGFLLYLITGTYRLTLLVGNGSSWFVNLQTGFIPVINTWYNVAVSRQGNIWGVIVNGKLIASAISYEGPRYGDRPFQIGRYSPWNNVATDFHGYIDQVRITENIARYSPGFTVQTNPFADSIAGDSSYNNVSLLLHMNGANGSTTFTDNSANNFTPTVLGNAQISTADSKFGGASAYLDGTGDYLSYADNAAFEFGSGDFTVEMWIKTNSSRQYATLISRGVAGFGSGSWTLMINYATATTGDVAVIVSNYSTSALLLQSGNKVNVRDNQWHHIAWVRSGTNHFLFVDGVPVSHVNNASFTIADINAATIIGADVNYTPRELIGYMDEVRITKGVARYVDKFTPQYRTLGIAAAKIGDPYYNDVSLLLHMDGSNGSTTFIDSSKKNLVVTPNGNVQLNTSIKRLGSASAYFDGTGDFLTLDGSEGFSFGSGDFTVEMWFRLNTLTADVTLYDSRPASTNGAYVTISVGYRGDINYYTQSGTRIEGSAGITINQWYHVALSRVSSQTKLFVNGIQIGATYADTNSYANGGSRPIIGALGFTTTSNNLNGYIDELRVTKGVGRYMNNFIPSTIPFEDTARATGVDSLGKYTTFLLRGEGFDGSNIAQDSSPLKIPLSIAGDVKTSTTDKKYGTSSFYFDGNGDYFTLPQNVLRFEREDFTIEYWVKLETNTALYPYQMGSSYFNANGGFYSHVTGPATGWGGTGTLAWNGSVSGAGGPSLTSVTGIRDNVWHHVAISRKGGHHAMWIDGNLESYGYTPSANYTGNQSRIFANSDTLGNIDTATYEKGYLDELRITRGAVRYDPTMEIPTSQLTSDANTKILLNVEGANNSTTFTDSSSNALTITRVGSPVISTTQFKMGSSSGYFNGSTSYLTATVPGGLGTAFTLEFWVYRTSNTGMFFNSRSGGSPGVGGAADGIDIFSDLRISTASAWIMSSGSSLIVDNQWCHIAIQRFTQSGTIYRFVNGIVDGTGSYNGAFTGTYFRIMGSDAGNVGYLNGYMDDFRVSSVARYPAGKNFTPPAAPFPDPIY